MLKVDGRPFPAEVSISVVKRGEEEELEAFVLTVQDVTERKQIEEKMAELSAELERANDELERAYETTLEGWTGVLDLRDKETEGHSRRVTEVTVRLALNMGIAEEDLVHIRRGALLHDIGKIGIPDGILLKPGSLTEEEWEVMRMHPVYAHDLLSQIGFLEEASVIPHCHHERWDGKGYPRGLAGEEIPLAARVFAVVDVWEALRSDRPYRRAWPEEKVREYIGMQAGTHFDPAVVEAFLAMDTTGYQRRHTAPLEAMMEIIERAHARDTLTRLTAKLNP
jgi:HD-GYP domain-containing protein (c-di-GMP phosphodiesterase class II)